MLSLKIKTPFGREELDSLQDALRAATAEAGFEHGTVVHLVYAVEEIGANVLVHSGATYLEMRFEADASAGILSFLDDGEEFDPVGSMEYLDMPVISEFMTGHLGLWTLKQMPFKRAWKRVDGINTLSFTAEKP